MIAVYILYLYLATGLLTAIWLLFFRKTHWNEGMITQVKLIIMPGCIVLWPVVISKSLRS